MTVERIGGGSVALYLTPEDLERHGGDTEELDLGWTLELAEAALRRHGIALEGTMEIDAFPNDCGVLLLVRICRPAPVFLAFPDLESVIRASRAAPAEGGRLFRTGGRYVLTLPEGPAAHALTEFADPLERPPGYEAWLLEHGEMILPEQALRRLAEGFPDNE